MEFNPVSWRGLSVDPIGMFWRFAAGDLERRLDWFVSADISELRIDERAIADATRRIKGAQDLINQTRESQRIANRKVANFFIVAACFALVGFFFLRKYKRNKAIIADFAALEAQQREEIRAAARERFRAMAAGFSATTFREILASTLNSYGMDVSEFFLRREIVDVVERFDALDVYSGIKGIVKNTPFYDLLLRQHVIRNVTTSNSSSFPYTETYYDSEGRRRTRTSHETLVAYHTEPTPFIESLNVLAVRTNYLPELTLHCSQRRVKKGFLFENSDFASNYAVNAREQNELLLTQFFTIKAQENFVDWMREPKRDRVFDFLKVPGTVIVCNDASGIPFMQAVDAMVLNTSLLRYDEDYDFADAIGSIKAFVGGYCEKLFQMLQVPLLVPGISREWYRESGQYLIGGAPAAGAPAIESTCDRPDFHAVLGPMFVNELLTFNYAAHPHERPPWLRIGAQTELASGAFKAEITLNSYYGIEMVDHVPVVGRRVGMHVIPVIYRRFFPMQEQKLALFARFENGLDCALCASRKLSNLVFGEVYADESFARRIEENCVWTDNPALIEGMPGRDGLLEWCERLNEISDTLNLDLAAKFDRYGVCVLINNVPNLTEAAEKSLLELVADAQTARFWEKTA